MWRYIAVTYFTLTLLPQNCLGVKKDVIWLYDVTTSVSATDQKLITEFIYNVTSYLTINSSEIRESVTKFDVEVTNEFQLNGYGDSKTNLLTAILGIPVKSSTVSTRKTMDALTYTKTSFLSIKGGRSNTPKAVILIVAGVSTNTSATILVANDIRSKYNAEIFVIGVGPNLTKTNEELHGVSNDPDVYYFEYIGGFIYLCGLIPSIVPKIDNETTALLSNGCYVWEDPIEETVVIPHTTINEGLSIGAIVGLALASLFLLGLLALILYLLCRKKKKKVKHKEDNILNAVNEYNDSKLGEKNYKYKRDNTVIPEKKPVIEKLPSVYESLGERNIENLHSVYESLGERSITSTNIKIKL